MAEEPLTAYQMGKIAHDHSIPDPTMDKPFMKSVVNLPIAANNNAFREWYRGWTDANLLARYKFN